MSQGNLWDLIPEPVVSNHERWVPEAPPSLAGIRDVELDCETTGLKWWEDDRPIGIALRTPNGRCQYLPWGHRGGGNLDEAVVRRWAQTELRGKRITNLNTRFDIHMMRAWGVDLEAQGNEVSDVGHYAALLDDHRQSFSLESIAQDYLGVGKVNDGMDKTRMAYYHAGRVAAYAEQDVRLVGELKAKMWPLLDEQDLQRVRALEDKVIYVVCEMEKNGAIIDMELLERWILQSEGDLVRCLLEIHKLTGFNINPASSQDRARLFQKLNLPIAHTDKGAPSFTDEVLKTIDHPVIGLLRRASKLTSLRSKYLLKYKKAVDSKGILRYSLHQLRAQKSDMDSAGESGTVSGRFSSSSVTNDVGANIQQVMKAAKQRVSFGFGEDDETHDDEIFIVRKLHKPGSGLFLSADAMQIEYRLFAGYAKSPRVLEAYKQDPLMSFHKFVWGMLKPFKPDLTYRRTKDCNFAKIYGAGLTKLAEMLEFITHEEAESLRKTKAGRMHPKLAQALAVDTIYNREMPEVPVLLREASTLAERRGYVHTLLGRRMRFTDKYARVHKAFNGVVQGGAADIMKQKLVELHDARKDTGLLLRYTVHDEVDGDVPDESAAKRVGDILNHQSFPELPVPILWEVATGPTWKDCK